MILLIPTVDKSKQLEAGYIIFYVSAYKHLILVKQALNALEEKANSNDRPEACYSDSLSRQNTSERQAFSQSCEYLGRHLPASICHPQGILVLLVYLPKIISLCFQLKGTLNDGSVFWRMSLVQRLEDIGWWLSREKLTRSR